MHKSLIAATRYYLAWAAVLPLMAVLYWGSGWAWFQLIAPIDSLVQYGEYDGEPGAWPARDVFPIGRVTWHYSKSRYPRDLLWVEWNEAIQCDTTRDGEFTQLASRGAPNRVYDWKARGWRLVGPWAVQLPEPITAAHLRQAGGWLACCMRSTVRVSPWPGVVRQLTINAQCTEQNTFWYGQLAA